MYDERDDDRAHFTRSTFVYLRRSTLIGSKDSGLHFFGEIKI